MRAIKCELCGSNQLFKKEGFFQCEYCGTKYSLEEARKLIGKVEIEGDVSVKEADFIIRAGVLEKYNGSDVNVVIPNNVSIIGIEAFKDCFGMESITIPNTVTRIASGGWGSFKNCIGLSKISLPPSMLEIGEFAFFGCKNLSEVNIPQNVRTIGYRAFGDCSNLSNIIIPYGIKKIENQLFENCRSLKSIVIPNSVTEIGDSSFKNCSSLASIIISNSVTKIGYRAFEGCKMLLDVSVPKELEHHFRSTPYWSKAKRLEGTCQHCGGEFRGIIKKVCSKCGKPKDY